MRPISNPLLDELDFTQAAHDEAAAWRNLLPPEPWLAAVRANPESFGNYTRFLLEKGSYMAPCVVVRSLKPHQQSRPVPIVGIHERIAYRALADVTLKDIPAASRGRDDYRDFVTGPLQAGVPKDKIGFRVKDSIVKYIVESDIAAFYEYIDHSVLLDELYLRSGKIEGPECIVELLSEIQPLPHGLPQLVDPSDELSEIYARILEREMVRHGVEVWRYNDDFHVTAKSYAEARELVELLARKASEIGLVLNERKTRIWKYSNYFWKNWIGPETEGDIAFKPELVRVSTEYGELEGEELSGVAHEILERVLPNHGRTESTRTSIDGEDSRELQHALSILTKQCDDFGLPYLSYIMRFAGHLTHRIGNYLDALQDASTSIADTWDELTIFDEGFNSWQRVWLVYLSRAGRLLGDERRRRWVAGQMSGLDALLHAECALALAPYGDVDISQLDEWTRTQPEPLIPWYALAATRVPKASDQRIRALRQSSRLIELMTVDQA